ncbi:uncharacterized protein LOC105389584 [Plutella xylostella]|uniref:uncharacterized protein LOC105389584 n=1 Tax=Plutella xylostella TaxID=51655 RepID=UPI0005D04A2C|nr:uncharacterized protein LOC105389584 [Plutella xylostella]
MAPKRSFLFYFAVILVVLSSLAHEAEARRKILRGRRVMTRTYYRGSAVPAWAVSLLAGLGMLLAGAALYALLHKLVLAADAGEVNTYQPALQNDV